MCVYRIYEPGASQYKSENNRITEVERSRLTRDVNNKNGDQEPAKQRVNPRSRFQGQVYQGAFAGNTDRVQNVESVVPINNK